MTSKLNIMEYVKLKDFLPSIRDLRYKGGKYQKAAEQVFSVIGKSYTKEDPFKGLRLTKHGEKRIKNCRKYDLIGFCRLITVVKDGRCYFCYTGSKNDCEKWLENNRGLVPSADKNGNLVRIFQSHSLDDPSVRTGGKSDFSYGKLYEKLDNDEDFDFLIEGVPRSTVRNIEELESINEETDILKAIEDIQDEDRKLAIYDVLALLRKGDSKAAGNRVALLRGDIVYPEPNTEIKDSEDFHIVPTDSPRELEQVEHYIHTADYRDWMMFMHHEQERIATEEFAGPAKLSGVSGSGKTCIVVKRAITLAERYPDGEILVLTLNKPLAGLIRELVLNYCAFPDVRKRIEVMSFFELCQKFLGKFEPKNKKLYDDQTWKTKEHIDEVWREYYRCELNNKDAECMQQVHDSLISQSIDAECYIREEFDWIRSAVHSDQRRDLYLEIERSGRSHPLGKGFRSMLLTGLDKWEKKMESVGISDYLGAATALYNYRDKLSPEYRCVLIDECQDFGTTELEIAVALAEDGPDNLFFCGDAAQHVSWKHQSFKDAGISLHGSRSMKINQNYRNSRYVLEAAYSVLYNNLTEKMIEKEDFEILDPKLANFSGPGPLCLKADSLEDETAYAIAYAESELEGYPNRKACVAICGYSLHQIQEFGKRLNFPVLEGTLSIEDDQLFLSDLEQTKGFEFDLVIIVNASDGVIPNPATPSQEQFRDLSKLYVAMTRAKLQLILSHSGAPSPYLGSSKVKKHFLSDVWEQYFQEKISQRLGEPLDIDILHEKHLKEKLPSIDKMTIEEFLYAPQARGLSRQLIRKFRELPGKENRKEEDKFVISEVVRDSIKYPEDAHRHFGPAFKEFQEFVKHLGL